MNMLTMAASTQIIQNRKLPDSRGTSSSRRKGTVKSISRRNKNQDTHNQNGFFIIVLSLIGAGGLE